MIGGTGWARRALTVLLVAATTAFIAWVVIQNSRELREHEWEVRPIVLLVSVAAYTGVLAWGVFVWSRVARGFGIRDARYGDLLRVWAYSNVAKYIPGAIWQFVAAARLAASSGIPQVAALSSMIVHVLLSLATAAVVAVFAFPLTIVGVSPELQSVLRVVFPLMAVAGVHPAVLNFALRLVPRALHREVLSWGATWLEGLGLLALALVSWALTGAAYFLFLRSLTAIPLSALPDVTAVNALSFAASYLAVLAPGGIGVKESAMTMLLSPLLPIGVAAVVSIGSRLWSVAAELAILLIASRVGARATAAPPSAAGG